MVPTVAIEPSSTRRRTASPAWGISFFLVAGCVVPLVILGITPNGQGPWRWFVVVVLVSASRYSILIARGQPRLYELTIWLFVYLFLGLAPMIQIRLDAYPETTPGMLTELEGRSAAIVLAGILALAIGMWLYRQTPKASRLRELDATKVKWLAVLSLLASWLYIAKVGSALFDSRDQYNLIRTSLWPNPVINSLIGSLSTTPLLVATAATMTLAKSKSKRIPAMRLLTAAEVPTLLILVNPISGARIAFGTVFLSLLAMLGAFATSRGFRISAITILVAMLLVFPYADAFRHGGTTDPFGKGGPVQAMTRGDYDSFAQINNTVNYVDRHGPTYGNQALGVLFFWVPRSIWPDKAMDTGVLLAKDRQYNFTNLSAPLWSEFYINGSWLALIAGMGLVGWSLRRLDEIRVISSHTGVSGTILPFYMLMILRGSLLQAIASLVVTVAMSALVAAGDRRAGQMQPIDGTGGLQQHTDSEPQQSPPKDALIVRH